MPERKAFLRHNVRIKEKVGFAEGGLAGGWEVFRAKKDPGKTGVQIGEVTCETRPAAEQLLRCSVF